MEIRAKDKQTTLILQAAIDSNFEFLSTISQHELKLARCNSGCTALHWAAGSNNIKSIQYLIETFHFPVDIPANKKSHGRTPLHYACRNGCLEAAQVLVEKFGANINMLAKHGVSPFQLAIWQNHLHICQWLVNIHHVDPCQVNDFNCGAVHWLGICPINRANYNNNKNKSNDDNNNHDTINNNDNIIIIDNNNDNTHYHDESTGIDLLPLAKWLSQQPGIDFHLRQRQGHTPMHKAAWGGHLALIQYLHQVHDLWDDKQDDAGNFAADLADMGHHKVIANYLRAHCSRDRAESCAILNVSPTATMAEIRKAYLQQAKRLHPDRQQQQQERQQQQNTKSDTTINNYNDSTPITITTTTGSIKSSSHDDFDNLNKAYRHLTIYGGQGKQSNPAHSLHLMLQHVGGTSNVDNFDKSNNHDTQNNNDNDNDCFKAQLIAVILEFGDKGLELSNVKKKWKQVWPDTPFPSQIVTNNHQTNNNSNNDKKRRKQKMSLSELLLHKAGDVITIVQEDKSKIRVFAKNCSQQKVAASVNTSKSFEGKKKRRK